MGEEARNEHNPSSFKRVILARDPSADRTQLIHDLETQTLTVISSVGPKIGRRVAEAIERDHPGGYKAFLHDGRSR